MNEYYDGTKLLSMTDLNKNKPEIYICTTNRTGGKTTYFGRYAMNRFFKYGEKFGLLYRFNYELDDIADKFFKDIGALFFPEYRMVSERRAKGIYHELFVIPADADDKDTSVRKSCGYAISLNSSDQLKKYSHLLSDITRLLFDEFQSETNHYCANEVQKLLSVHTSIARGHGEQVRYVPVIMIGNDVSILNPYYVALGIASRLQENTKFLKGDGFVMEHGFIESASRAQKESQFNRAFANTNYVKYASSNTYLNDNSTFVEKMSGRSKYLCTIRYDGTDYGVRSFDEAGVIYCDTHPDSTFANRIAVTTEDHNVNFVMLKRNELFISTLRELFEKGCFRFHDLQCKQAVLQLLSY